LLRNKRIEIKKKYATSELWAFLFKMELIKADATRILREEKKDKRFFFENNKVSVFVKCLIISKRIRIFKNKLYSVII